MYKAVFILLLVGCSVNKSIPMEPVNPYITKYKQYHISLNWYKQPRVRFIDVGSGDPVLLIHGHQSRIEEFRTIIPELSKYYRVIAFDLPGSGYSDQPDVEYGLDLYSHYITQFIKQYIGEPVIIAGGSMGANLALIISREHPELVKKTVAWSPAGMWSGNNILSWLAENFMGGVLYIPILRVQSTFWFSKNCPYSKDAFDNTIKYINEIDSPIFRRAASQLAADQLHDDNSHFGKGHLNKQPTLIMVGELDNGLDLANGAVRFAKELPDGKIIIIKNSGHSVHLEKPYELLKHILNFIK